MAWLDGSIELALTVLGFGFVGVVVSRITPVRHWLHILAFAIALAMGFTWVWLMIIFFNLVSFDAIARSFGVFDSQPYFRSFVWIPPQVATLTYTIEAWRRLRRTRARGDANGGGGTTDR